MLQVPLPVPGQPGTCFSGRTRLQQPGQECGCDATGRPSPAAPACSHLLPWHRVEREEESRAGGAALQGHPSPRQMHSACAARGQGCIKGGFTEARGVFPKSVFACAQVRAFPALERCLVLSSCLLWPQPRGLSPGQSSPEQCPVCSVGRGIHGPAVTGKRALGCFHPRACHRRLSRQIPPHPDTCRAAGNAHTAGVPLGGLRLSHSTVTSRTCHLPAPVTALAQQGRSSCSPCAGSPCQQAPSQGRAGLSFSCLP